MPGPSSHRGRKTEKKIKERMSGPICLCPKLKHRGSPPLLTVQLNFSGGWKEVGTAPRLQLFTKKTPNSWQFWRCKRARQGAAEVLGFLFPPWIRLFVSIIRHSHISSDYCLGIEQLMPGFWELAQVQCENSSPSSEMSLINSVLLR